MKPSRAVAVTGASAALLVWGWEAGAATLAGDIELAPGAGSVSQGASPSASPAPSSTPEPAAPATTTTTTTTTTAPKPAAPAGPTGVFKGPRVSTSYGDMQVQIVVRNGKITDVQPLVVGYGDSTSRRINSNALPTLEARVLSAQTWNVSYVSGASYTSYGILNSVKGAMRSAGI